MTKEKRNWYIMIVAVVSGLIVTGVLIVNNLLKIF